MPLTPKMPWRSTSYSAVIWLCNNCYSRKSIEINGNIRCKICGSEGSFRWITDPKDYSIFEAQHKKYISRVRKLERILNEK